jgi:hypothetical protein
MIEQTVYVRASQRNAVRTALHSLPGTLARGTGPIAQGYRNGLAFGLLQKVTENLVANSEIGGNPDVNLNWPPLAESTLHQRLHKTSHRSRTTQKARERNMSPDQKATIRKRINEIKSELIEDGLEPFAALGLARAQVYNQYRAAGVKIPTRRELVPMLRDTGIGVNALSPVAFDDESGSYQPPRAGANPDTGEPVEPIFENNPGEIAIGVRGYFALHHLGGKRLPQRRLWPEPEQWPESWWDHIADVTNRLSLNAAVELAKGAA